MERAALQNRESLGDELGAAVDQSRFLGAILQRTPRDVLVVRFVGLPEIRSVRVGDCTLAPHPVQGSAGVEAARECDADFFTGGDLLKDIGHYGQL